MGVLSRAASWPTAVLLTAFLSCAPTAWAGPPTPGPPAFPSPGWTVPVAGQWNAPPSAPAPNAVVSEVNRRRSEEGCAAVRLRTSLDRAAQAHSSDMAAHRLLTHTGTDGSAPENRMRTAGYRPVATGETIEIGPADAGAAVAAWMAGPPHRAILLTCRYTDAGVGRTDGPDGAWWTLDLASRD